MSSTAVARGALLPSPVAWKAAAMRRMDLFDPLDPGARVGLVARSTPEFILVWEVGQGSVRALVHPFAGYSSSGADIVLCADYEALTAIGAAVDENLFEALRAGIRSGHVVCYILRRRCHREERGFEELLTARFQNRTRMWCNLRGSSRRQLCLWKSRSRAAHSDPAASVRILRSH